MKNKLKEKIVAHISKTYGDNPENIFEKYPEISVVRHKENRKWYCLFMSIDKSVFSEDLSGKIEILNLKAEKLLSGSIRRQNGIYPAYHMNKEHWISIVLDRSVPFNDIIELIDMSYNLTL